MITHKGRNLRITLTFHQQPENTSVSESKQPQTKNVIPCKAIFHTWWKHKIMQRLSQIKVIYKNQAGTD